MDGEMIKASNYTCKCGKLAEYFFPCGDDIISPMPYCAKCVDEKEELYIRKVMALGRPKKKELPKTVLMETKRYCTLCGKRMPCLYHIKIVKNGLRH